MNKKLKLGIGIAAGILLAYIGYNFIFGASISEDTLIVSQVKRGEFESLVFSTGQLQAENSVSINAPKELSARSINIYEIKVTKLIEEGTVVDSGEYVASLDHSAVEEKLSDALTALTEKLESFEDAKIDTNINLSNLRDDLLGTRIDLEEKELILRQSKYESPAVIRQAELNLSKAERKLEQDLRNYKLKKQQSQFKVKRSYNEVKKVQDRVNDIENLFEALDIKAPAPGMLIYSFNRMGNKIKVGSSVNRWEPTIAELPDLTSMISKTFINEVDISKVTVGQKVMIGVDAFAEKQFKGEVLAVANIGQVIPGGDAKVFEVTIKVNGSDSDLRPAMTTSNKITTQTLSDVIYIPLEAVFYQDSIPFVYSTKGLQRKAVYLGPENENYVVVEYGLTEEDKVYLNEPTNKGTDLIEGIEMYDTLKLNKSINVSLPDSTDSKKHIKGKQGKGKRRNKNNSKAPQ